MPFEQSYGEPRSLSLVLLEKAGLLAGELPLVSGYEIKQGLFWCVVSTPLKLQIAFLNFYF